MVDNGVRLIGRAASLAVFIPQLFLAKQPMSTENPPFDPPYVSIRYAEGGVTYSETLADGSTRPIPTAQVRWVQIGQSSSTNALPARSSQPPNSGSKASSQGKVFLNVPFAEKDQAKALGARWDATRKKWYVPHGGDAKLLAAWWPDGLKQP